MKGLFGNLNQTQMDAFTSTGGFMAIGQRVPYAAFDEGAVAR